MKRQIYNTLKLWKDDSSRRPLLMRGARQVGKTYIIEQFGKNEFKNIVTINFERNPKYKEVFDDLDPIKIVQKISLISGKEISNGKTLLFFDEIQECPKAISALRYFFEEMNELHIIAAGSLLEFALKETNFKMPVGRVQYIFLKPLNFIEFLEAIDETNLVEYISNFNNIVNIPKVVHDRLNVLIRDYFILGGMPAVLNEYIKSKNIHSCQKIQRSIIDTYTDDFAKYANKSRFPILRKVFNSASAMIGQKFVYSHVDNTIKSAKLKEAVEMLETAGVLIRVKRSNGDGLPLEANVKDNFFKLIFLDIGLLHNVANVYEDTILSNELASVFRGAVAEQFVGQELAAYQDYYRNTTLYYWAREARNSSAEIDYLMEHNGEIIPIEVKSGKTGTLKSLMIYIHKYHSTKALKISQNPYEKTNAIISIPFYGISAFLNNN